MGRDKLIRQVLAKLKETKKLNEDETEEIIFDNFVNRQESINDNYSKKIKLDNEKHDLLRRLYTRGSVKQLYGYGTQKFGFEAFNMRFDVNSGFLDIKKLNS